MSLLSVAVCVTLVQSLICHGTAAGYGKRGGKESSKGNVAATSEDSDEAYDESAPGEISEFSGVIDLSPDKVMHIGGRSGTSSGKGLIFGEGYDAKSGSRGTGISVKEGTVKGQGIGVAIGDKRDKGFANGNRHEGRHTNRDYPHFQDGFEGNGDYQIPGLLKSSSVVVKLNVIWCLLLLILFLLWD